jgi:hypothetical protein
VFLGRLARSGAHGLALRINSPRPIQLFHEWPCRKEHSVGAIEHAYVSIPVCLYEQFPGSSLINRVDLDRGFKSAVML